MAVVLADVPYTWIEERIRSGKRVVALLPVGATEAHGPHLPLSTDVVISEGFCAAAAELIEAELGFHAVILPPLAYTPAEYASGFAGTISIRWETMGAILRDIGRSLKGQGFACLAVVNSHFDPANVNVLRAAAEEIAADGLPVAFADATRRKLASQMSAEFQSGDCHGGEFETSIVMARAPGLVRGDVGAMPGVRAGLLDAVRQSAGAGAVGAEIRFETVGMDQAYCGTPSTASAEKGRASMAVMARAIADAVAGAV